MTAFKQAFIFVAISILGIFACSTAMQPVINLPPKGEFFDHLSDYGLLADLDDNPYLVKYEVTNELFSDYAVKDRYVYVPEGKHAMLRDDGFFDWPEGSMMVKNFAYSEAQLGNARSIETRLLIKDESEWKAISYVWNDDESDAKIAKVGDLIPLEIDHKKDKLKFDYIVPNKNQCKSCHNYNEQIDPIGFKYANLDNKIIVDGSKVSQLDFLEKKGIIKLGNYGEAIEPMIAYNDESQDIQKRALAYLDINCGHCHRPEGPGNTSGLYLQYDETRTNHMGFCKGPVAAGKGSGGRKFDIYPGVADSSILYYRMASVDPGSMMPEVGRGLAHKEGLSIIEQWINNIDYDCLAQ